MVKVIMGLSGSGKTKELIQSINDAISTESGSMVCIEKGNKLTFDIDYRVRLIEASEYQVNGYTFLKGFISGLHAGNFDISHIFIDSLFKIAGSKDLAEAEDFFDWCAAFGQQNNLKFTMVVSDDPEKMPEGIRKYLS
ncbi:MAG: hypothetical protein HFF17_11275 [Oscillospiraceae bacterium]|nr:hypothetical protein [Oscillospiraceae bacterium]